MFWSTIWSGSAVTSGDDVKRRTFLVGALGLVVTALRPEHRQRLNDVIARRHAPDMEVVEALEELLGHLRLLDDRVGPRLVLSSAQATICMIDNMAQDSHGKPQQALMAIAAQFEQFTGWLQVDIGNQAQAVNAYNRAVVRAVESSNQALVGYLLACKSEMALKADKAEPALRYARGARDRSWGMSPATIAWANDLEARALARQDSVEECRRRLDRAAELLVHCQGEPPWIYHFTDPRVLDIHRGICR